MNAILTSLLTLVSSLTPLATGASTISSIISTLTEVVPLIVKEFQDVVPFVKNIITTLRGNSEVTQDQLDQLDILEAKVDAAFDAQVTRVTEEDKT